MLNHLRKDIFWLKDKMGGRVRYHYEDIKAIIDARGDGKQEKYTTEVLSHAVSTVPYYRKHVGSTAILDLRLFPVINKTIIKENHDDFMSSQFSGKKLHQMSTSGSTGTPFKVYQCENKRGRVLAELIYFNELAGQNIGDRFMYFRVWTDANKKSFISRFAQNIVCVDVRGLDHSTYKDVLHQVETDKSLKSCLGYAHTFEYFCRYVESERGKITPRGLRSIVTSSEVMPLEMKRRIKDVVGCQVYDRYSNQENGVIAQSDDCSDSFLVNYPSYLVEILGLESDDPVSVGEIGRIVVTDLFNYAMPLIRYDTGDLALRVDAERFARNLKSIQGRQVDMIYDCWGTRLTPHLLTNHMWGFDKLSQYQFIQEGEATYRLKVAGAKGKYSQEEFLAVLKPILGQRAEIHIDYVESVPVLASGKFKKIVCNYHPL